VLALGEPSVPVTCWAATDTAPTNAATAAVITNATVRKFIDGSG